MRRPRKFAAGLIASAALVAAAGAPAAEQFKKLSAPQIRAALTDMELTDEVHWRDVYQRDGTLRTYGMGKKRLGKWSIVDDQLCIDLPAPDDRCYEVRRSGRNFQLWQDGTYLSIEGILQPPSDPK